MAGSFPRSVISPKLLAAIAPYAKGRRFEESLVKVAKASRHRYETHYDFLRVSNHYELPPRVREALFASGGHLDSDSYFEDVIQRNLLTEDGKKRLIDDLHQSRVSPKAVLDIALLHIRFGEIDDGEILAVEAIKKSSASGARMARRRFSDLPSPAINRALGPESQIGSKFFPIVINTSRAAAILSKNRPGEAVRYFYKYSNFDSAASLGRASWLGLDITEKILTIRALHSCFRIHEAKEVFEGLMRESQDEIVNSAELSLKLLQAGSILEFENSQFVALLLSSMPEAPELNAAQLSLLEHLDPAAATSEVLKRLSTVSKEGNDFVRLIEMSERLMKPRRIDRDLAEKLLDPNLLSIKRLLLASRNLRYEEVIAALSEYSNNGFRPFFLFPQLLRISFLDDVNGEGEKLRRKIADFWLSPDSLGSTRLAAASPDKREALLSKLMGIDSEACSKQISQNSFEEVHLYHRTAMALRAFTLENYELALEELDVVTRELPRLSIARNLLNMTLLRLNPSPLLALEAQKGKTHGNAVDSALFSALQMSGVYDRTLLDSYRELTKRIRSETPQFNLLQRTNPTGGDRVLVIENCGVSDEIRAVQELRQLEKLGLEVTMICDPRFLSLFRHSFPQIEFLSFQRKHKIQRTKPLPPTESNKDSVRKYISNFIPEAISSDLERYDHILLLDSLVQERLARLERPVEGGYIKTPGEVSASEVIKIGFVWRSAILSGMRALIYMSVEELITPFLSLEGVKLVSLQHGLSEAEHDWLSENGVEVPNINFYDDFEAVAVFCKGLDLVIGLSTSSFEIAAASGTPVWTPGFSPENYFLRTSGGQTRRDVLTSNSEVFAPQKSNFASARQEVISDVLGQMRARIEEIQLGASSPNFLREPESPTLPLPLTEKLN